MVSVRSIKRVTPFIWKKPVYYPIFKILITRHSGQTDDITQAIYNGELVDGVTNLIGDFRFTI